MQSDDKRTHSVTVKFSSEEIKTINKAWKGTDHMNRSQYVREIIMNYVNKKNNTQTNRY